MLDATIQRLKHAGCDGYAEILERDAAVFDMLPMGALPGGYGAATFSAVAWRQAALRLLERPALTVGQRERLVDEVTLATGDALAAKPVDRADVVAHFNIIAEDLHDAGLGAVVRSLLTALLTRPSAAGLLPA